MAVQAQQRLVPAPGGEVELRERPRRQAGRQGEPALERQRQHLVGVTAALRLVAAQPGQPGQHGDRQRAGVAGADVVGQPHRLVGVGGGVGQPALPQRDERAQAEGLRQQREGPAIAGEDDGAVEVAPGAGPVAEEDGAAAGLLDLLDDLEARRPARAPPRSSATPAAASPAMSRLMPFMSRLGNSSASLRGSVSSSASMLVDGARVAAHGGGHARAHQQPEPRRAGRPAAPSGQRRPASRRRRPGARSPSRPCRARASPVPRAIGSCSSGSARSSSATAWPTRPASADDVGGRQEPLRPTLRIGVELGRALERPRRGRVAAAARGVVGGEGQRLGRLVVGCGGGGRAVPRAPVGVRLVVERRRPAPRAPRAARRSPRRGRRPSAAADGGSAAACPGRRAGRRARRRRAASGRGRARSEARSSVPTSPLSSAAASTSRRRASSPSGSTRAMKARSMRSLSGRSMRSGARPARSSSVRAPGSSSSASGLPPVAPTRSSRTTAGSAPSSRARASAALQPAEPQLGQPVRIEVALRRPRARR